MPVQDQLAPGADAIRAADPEALIAGPALAHLTSGERDWYDWLLEILQHAAEGLDVVTELLEYLGCVVDHLGHVPLHHGEAEVR